MSNLAFVQTAKDRRFFGSAGEVPALMLPRKPAAVHADTTKTLVGNGVDAAASRV